MLLSRSLPAEAASLPRRLMSMAASAPVSHAQLLQQVRQRHGSDLRGCIRLCDGRARRSQAALDGAQEVAQRHGLAEHRNRAGTQDLLADLAVRVAGDDDGRQFRQAQARLPHQLCSGNAGQVVVGYQQIHRPVADEPERGFARDGLEDLKVRVAQRIQRRVQQAQDIALIVN